MSSHVLQLERTVAHLHNAALRAVREHHAKLPKGNLSEIEDAGKRWRARFSELMLRQWVRIETPLTDGEDYRNLVQRSWATRPRDYFTLDFGDFLEYATSPLARDVDLAQFAPGSLSFYEALPGTYEAPLFESEDDLSFSIVGVAISQFEEELVIYLVARYFEERAELGIQMATPSGTFSYFIAGLVLHPDAEDAKRLVEGDRFLLVPERKDSGELAFSLASPLTVNLMRLLVEMKTREGDPRRTAITASEANLKRAGSCFEVARLMAHLPNYYAFMYDLVREERIRSSEVPRPKLFNNRKARSQPGPRYRLVKSIRVVYSAEENARRKAGSEPRSWTAPSYRYSVRGHWRALTHPWWKGRGPDGEEVLGRTWVHEYEKGTEEGETRTEIVTRDPQVVIKIKQPLSYARDVVEAYTKKPAVPTTAAHNEERESIPASGSGGGMSRPTAEWMYEERKKLTAGLRYMILRRDSYRCVLCGADASREGVVLEVDHTVPIAEWGRTVEENLRTTCRTCNRGKGGAV